MDARARLPPRRNPQPDDVPLETFDLDCLFVHAPKAGNHYLPLGDFFNVTYMPMGLPALAELVRRAGRGCEIVHLGGKSIEGTRCEVRCPDPSSNTYLAFAAMIAAGLDGVEKGMTPAEPVEESLFEMDAARIAEKGIRELPGTLGEALDELERDEVIRDALGDHIFNHYVDAKRSEWDEYRTQVSDWEVERYLDEF